MRKTINVVAAVLCGLLLNYSESAAQIPPFVIGLRAGAALETSGAGKGHGGSFDTDVRIRIGDRFAFSIISGLADLGQHAAADNVKLEANGFSLGLQAMLGTRSGRRPSPWVRAGIGGYEVLAGGGSFESLDAHSPFKLGFDLAAGLDFAITPNWHLSPGLRAVGFSQDWEFVSPYESGRVGNVRYVTLDLGLAYWLGAKNDPQRP